VEHNGDKDAAFEHLQRIEEILEGNVNEANI
jgi:hypothetical protein